MSLKSDCFLLIKNAIEGINPQKLVKNNLRIINGGASLLVNNKHEYKLNKNVYIAAFGKAVSGMCIEVENIVREHFVKGIAVVPVGSNIKPVIGSNIKFLYGAHNNIPDIGAHEAAKEIFEMCKSLDKSDLLITCVSGGGSALLPLPVDEVSLDEKITTIKLVASAGATINELNTIRGCISKVKCGGLARAAYPATVVSLIISDVIGDPLDVIASGATYIPEGRNDKFKNALKIIEKYGLGDTLPIRVVEYIREKSRESYSFEIDDAVRSNTHNYLIGNNQLALEAVSEHATKLNYIPSLILTNTLDGEAKEAAKYFAYLTFILSDYSFYKDNLALLQDLIQKSFNNENQIKQFYQFLDICLKNMSNKFCILSGGETTVKLTGDISNSLGGRNQEMVLAFKKELTHLHSSLNRVKNKKFLFTSFGTDGIDGPTDAAGAIITNDDINNDVEFMTKCLLDHNSYRYFENMNSLIKIGHTGTNVMDMQILLLDNSF